MNMTHIIRGDDHKINTFKQIQIYQAMKWELPSFAHIPLIHTIEGKNYQKEIKPLHWMIILKLALYQMLLEIIF